MSVLLSVVPTRTLLAQDAIFVATTGSDAASGLEPGSPCLTIMRGLALAQAAGAHEVRVQMGIYRELVTPQAGIVVSGGYANDWTFAAQTPALVTITGVATPGLLASVAIACRTAQSGGTLRDLTVRSGDGAVGAPNAIAILVEAGELTLDGVLVIAGNGLPGSQGAAGVDAAPALPAMNGGTGNDAVQESLAFSDQRTPGGRAGTSTGLARGGAGGSGGAMDTSQSVFTSNFNATPGAAGENGLDGTGRSSATGGFGGGATPSGRGGDGQPALPGRTGDSGVAGSPWLPAADWHSQSTGGGGGTGTNGGGGGGGGGSGGDDAGTDSRGAGGGGGGGGGLFAPQSGR
ncbi:MAG: hypothetical protein H0X38_13520, partial [Planctomycetes bacterium]|nr:hypothetical protein [Planctomycetota bacterium]